MGGEIHQEAIDYLTGKTRSGTKFIAYTNSAAPLITTVLGKSNLDEGFIQLQKTDDAARFVRACRKLRLWKRKSELTVNAKRQNGHVW